MLRYQSLIGAFFTVSLVITGDPVAAASPEIVRVADVAFIPGASITLTGIGLVTGLPGTGDGVLVGQTDTTLAATLRHHGINATFEPICVGEVAAVLVTTTVRPGMSAGERIDVSIVSIGDASSLAGGRLEPLQLVSTDGHVSAVAEGLVDGANSIWVSGVVRQGSRLAEPVFCGPAMAGAPMLVSSPYLSRQQASRLVDVVNCRLGRISTLSSDGVICVTIPVAYASASERQNLLRSLGLLELSLTEPLVAQGPFLNSTPIPPKSSSALTVEP